jgi:membrane-bound serine protease (ClpP class)
VLPLALTVSGLCLAVAWAAIRAQRGRVDTGVEGLTGEIATVTEDLAPEGKVFVRGEVWNATTTGPALCRGARVAVERVDGLHLVVGPLGEPPTERS